MAGALVHRRPTFIVDNGTRSGVTGTLQDRIEVATDTEFGSLTAALAVHEGNGQTSITLNVDLAPGRTYYWRARTIDIANTTQSAYSDTRSFRTLTLEDGLYPYRLIVRLPQVPACLTIGATYKYDWAWDDTLVITGDHFVFDTHPTTAFSATIRGLHLDAQRAADSVAGTVGGTDIADVNHSIAVGLTFSGSMGGTGLFSGDVSGGVSVQGETPNPTPQVFRCGEPGFTLALIPR